MPRRDTWVMQCAYLLFTHAFHEQDQKIKFGAHIGQ